MNIRDLDLNLLVVFDTVAAEKSMTGAAKVLGMTQPAISNAMLRLETTLQRELFTRAARGVEPTAFAYRLMPEVTRFLDTIKRLASETDGTVRIGFTKTATSLMFAAIRSARCQDPPPPYSFKSQTSDYISARMKKGDIDLGIMLLDSAAPLSPQEFEIRKLDPLTSCLVVSDSHPLASLEVARIKDLKGFPIASYPPSIAPTFTRKAAAVYEKHIGVPMEINYYVHDQESLFTTLLTTKAFTLLPFSAKILPVEGLKMLPFSDPDIPAWEYVVVWRRNKDDQAITAAANLVIDSAHQLVRLAKAPKS